SSFNLQAQSFSLFPSFQIGEKQVSELKDFFAFPRIDTLLQDYIEVVGNPTETMESCLEYFAESPQSLIGRVTLTNLSDSRQEASYTLNAQLSAMGEFSPLASTRVGNHTILKAQTGNLTLSLAFDIATKAILSPLQALRWKHFIEAKQSVSFFWRLQAHNQAALLARGLERPFPPNWDATISRKRVEDQNQSLQISCEDPDWQLVFDSMQRQAGQLLVDEGEKVRYYQMRNPTNSLMAEKSASTLGIGLGKADALSLYQLCLCLLPTQPQDCERLLDHYLEGLLNHSQTNRELPTPILVSLAWRIFKHTLNLDFLKHHYPTLKELCFAWFENKQDRDLDGLPEWSSNIQTGLSNLPCFNLLDRFGFPALPSSAESSGLAALLESELEAIGLVAHLLEDNPTEAVAHSLKNRLTDALEAWLSNDSSHGLQNAITHHSSVGSLLYDGLFSGKLNVAQLLPQPNQICGQLSAKSFTQKPLSLQIAGKSDGGDNLVETVQRDEIRWLPGIFFFQGRSVFSEVQSITVVSSEQEFNLRLFTPDYSSNNIMHLLTLLPAEEEVDLDAALNAHLGFLPAELNYGIPENLNPESSLADETVNLAWNALIIEHLVKNNHHALAGKLFARLVCPIKNSLKNFHKDYEHYLALSGKGRGNQNHVNGLLPLELLLDIAGVRIITPEKVSILGENGLPWPITLRFQGLEIIRDGKNTQVTFADGSSFHHYGSSPKTFTKPD
ncbi:MAG TPA: hypothetical protein VLR89_04975, partial [Anaerolineaceae bacterium]|nr:hypothetical protein [Anaerolineaceae bacterium]